jgi:phosphoenolpyruvate carboxykinase (GTP)
MPTPAEKWVSEIAALTEPAKIHWCDGSDAEVEMLLKVAQNEEKINGRPVLTKLNEKLWPNSYIHLSDSSDVARTENLTFICHSDKEKTGPNNNWMAPAEAKEKLTKLTKGCMKGRTMYVLPFVMGHPDSPCAKFCVQVTDSSYVALSMRIMTRMGKNALERIGDRSDFIRAIHSVGDLNIERRFIMHFPEENLVWSIGSGYGGNALLGKKCIALRLASWNGLNEGWLAEHMIIIGIEAPNGETTYVAAAFPSACGKTNLAMLQSALPGYKIWTLGDDIAWMTVGEDGRLYAINPEAGFFGVAPGTSAKTNPVMLETLKRAKNLPTIFTNVAVNTDTNEPWWEGLSDAVPANLTDWQGRKFDPANGPAAHPNSRFTVSTDNCPTFSPLSADPKGVPISAIIFGGRRSSLVPLVYETFGWNHGVFCGATMKSETTAAAQHKTGQLRRDPMAMLPFCGYNMGEYFKHWIRMGGKIKNAPKIFFVNWFRKNTDGKFLWPGFGQNIRVLKWIIERAQNKIGAKKTQIGLVPNIADLSLENLNVDPKNLEELFNVPEAELEAEKADAREFLKTFGDHTPPEFNEFLA